MALNNKRLMWVLGPPIAAGIVLGANQARAGIYLSWTLSIIYWLALACVTWLTLAAATVLTRYLLRPWQPRDWIVWSVGGFVGSFAARPLIYAISDAFRPLMVAPSLRTMPHAELSVAFANYYVTNWLVILVMWIAACWVERAWREAPDSDAFWFASAQPVLATSTPPHEELAAMSLAGFLRRVPADLRRDVIALHSEDHYVRVFTLLGNTLVLGTLSEAADSLAQAGLRGQRVHRSWWVANDAVLESVTHGRRRVVRLTNGLEVPVSQTYRELARQAGIVR